MRLRFPFTDVNPAFLYLYSIIDHAESLFVMRVTEDYSSRRRDYFVVAGLRPGDTVADLIKLAEYYVENRNAECVCPYDLPVIASDIP